MRKISISALCVSMLVGMFVFVALPHGTRSLRPQEVRAAAVDFFLKIDGIDGESTDKKHANEIDVMSWSWGMSQSGSIGSGGGGGAGKVTVHDLSFTHRIDKATPKLLTTCASGKHIKDATLTVRNPGGDDYYKIKLTDVLCTEMNQAGANNNDLPTEQISLNFAKIEIEYTPTNKKGTTGSPLKAGWDFRGNRESFGGDVVLPPVDVISTTTTTTTEAVQ
jgi:type VI secretion system secreted protein Hcp